MYVFQKFPTWRYHPSQPAKIFNSEAELEAAGPGWVDNPNKIGADDPEDAENPKTPEAPIVANEESKEPEGVPVPVTWGDFKKRATAMGIDVKGKKKVEIEKEMKEKAENVVPAEGNLNKQ